MKTYDRLIRLTALALLIFAPAVLNGQGGLLGNWKYTSQQGEMNMQITATTIVINSQSFPYKAQGNVLMINEGTTTTPYPYMIDGNTLTLEFPGGMEVVFTRAGAGAPAPTQQGGLPQSMARPSMGMGQGQGSSSLSGTWVFQNQQGQLVLEFQSANQLSFNGETAQYQLKQGVIQVMGDYGPIDYPYVLNQGVLTITFPDGSQIPFSRSTARAQNPQANYQQDMNQQGMNQQQAGGGSLWQLRGTLCSWSGSSDSYSGYSRTQRIAFDGQGNFQFGTEASFSSGAGIAYGSNPNVQTGTYTVGQNNVTLRFQDGSVYEVKINMRQDNGMITELMYNGTLYATALCE